MRRLADFRRLEAAATGALSHRRPHGVCIPGKVVASRSCAPSAVAIDSTLAGCSDLLSREVANLRAPHGLRRCLWIVGSGVPRVTAPLQKAWAGASDGRDVFFDFGTVEDRNFELVLEALERSLTASIVNSAVAIPEGADGFCREVLRRSPGLADDLTVLAETLAKSDASKASSLSKAAAEALDRHRASPAGLWAGLAARGGDHGDGAASRPELLAVLQAAAAHAERLESPSGWVERQTGKRRVPYLLTGLEAVAAATGSPISVALLRVDVLMRSLFIDERGEELLAVFLEHLQRRGDAKAPSPIRALFQTGDSSTAFWALSAPLAERVVPLPSAAADADELSVGVLALREALEDDAAVAEPPDGREQARFEWQMDQVLGHPAVLELRRQHAEAPTAFAVVFWETIRHICRRPHLPVPDRADDLKHPILQAMLHANFLEPRWAPSRLVVAGQATRERLLAWIDAQHAKLPWHQRLEYNLQFLRERHTITRKLDRLAR